MRPRQGQQLIEVDRISVWVSVSAPNVDKSALPADIRFRPKAVYIRCTFGFGVLQLVNSVVAESRVQSLSCGGRECASQEQGVISLTVY